MKLIASFILTFFLIVPQASYAKKVCSYQYDASDLLVEGTGYKFTEKTGVTASFKKVRLLAQGQDDSIVELLRGTKVEVDLQSIDSGNPLRDGNLNKALFTQIKNKGKAVVTVAKVMSDQLVAKLLLNGVEKDVTFKYTFKDNHLDLVGQIDAMDYEMAPMLKTLNELCRIFHKGKDGVVKTWSDFALHVRVRMVETCK